MPKNILVLCTGNSCRSIIAEALLNAKSRGRFNAFSAGSRPTGQPNPRALAVLASHGLPTAGYRSKSWDEFTAPGAPQLDLVITVCSSAAGETCPLWTGSPLQVHWGIADPAHATGTETEIAAAFELTYQQLDARVSAFLALDEAGMSGADYKAALTKIGQMEGAE